MSHAFREIQPRQCCCTICTAFGCNCHTPGLDGSQTIYSWWPQSLESAWNFSILPGPRKSLKMELCIESFVTWFNRFCKSSWISIQLFFVWLVRSPGTVYHWTFVRHRHYQLSKTCSWHIYSLVPISPTNCFAEYEQQTLYDALVVTSAMWMCLINCRFIIIVITML